MISTREKVNKERSFLQNLGSYQVEKILVFNLPAKTQLTRRYMCSYSSPVSLLPPLELLSTVSIAKEIADEVFFIDAVAEGRTIDEIKVFCKMHQISSIITLLGLETIEEDLLMIESIKAEIPSVITLVFGHYATLFSKEILENTRIDAVIKGEPERAVQAFLSTVKRGEDWRSLSLLCTKAFPTRSDIPLRDNEITTIPPPAFSMMNANLYFEPFLPKPFGMLQTARGCPYQCNYCVKSYGYGNRLTLQSAEQVVEDIEALIELHQIKSLRFIDDTFTVNKKRVIEICKLMTEKKINIQWTCLSRADNLTKDLLKCMKQAGCRRIYFGLESGSQEMLDFYKKDINVDDAKKVLLQVREQGIETTGFFLLGLPNERDVHFQQTINFALESQLSMAAIESITLYPGTELFEKYKDLIEFSLFPYVNRFKDDSIEKIHESRKREFYRRFYCRSGYLADYIFSQKHDLPSLFRTIGLAAKSGIKDFKFMPGINKK